jgi:DNA polymerase III subunit gamma/tau
LRVLNDLAKGGKDLGRLLSDLLNHFRNLLIFQVSRGDLNLIEASEAEAASLSEQAAMADANALARIMETLAGAELRLRDAASKKILIEVTLLKAIEARNAVSIDSVLKRLQDLRGGATGSPAPAAPQPRTQSAAPAQRPVHRTETEAAPQRAESRPAAPVAAAPTAAFQESAAPTEPPPSGDLETLWARLVEAAGRASPFVRSYLIEAHPVSFAKNLFTIGFAPEFEDHIALVDNARNHTLLQTKLSELGHPNSQFKFVKAERPSHRVPAVVETPAPAAPAPATSAAPASAAAKPAPAPAQAAKDKPASVPFNTDYFKNDPLIQKALEVFKGTIV